MATLTVTPPHSASTTSIPSPNCNARSKSPVIPHVRIDDSSSMEEKFVVQSGLSGGNLTSGMILGKGTFGTVCLAQEVESGLKYAIKKVNKERAGTMGLKLLEREVDILKRVQHPNIITLHSVFETPRSMYLVLDYCDKSDLKRLLKSQKNGRFSEAETRELMNKLADAVYYLHKEAIIHRDLKLENVLCISNEHEQVKFSSENSRIDDKNTPSTRSENSEKVSGSEKFHEKKSETLLDFDIRLIDFGLSVMKDGNDSMIDTWVGTPLYMAPEVVKKTGYSHLCDIWSLGVIFHLLLSGSFPFYSDNEETLYKQICAAKLKFNTRTNQSNSSSTSATKSNNLTLPNSSGSANQSGSAKFWNSVSEAAKHLLGKMLHPVAAHRYSAGEVLDHPFVTGTDWISTQRQPSNVLELMSEWAKSCSGDEMSEDEETRQPSTGAGSNPAGTPNGISSSQPSSSYILVVTNEDDNNNNDKKTDVDTTKKDTSKADARKVSQATPVRKVSSKPDSKVNRNKAQVSGKMTRKSSQDCEPYSATSNHDDPKSATRKNRLDVPVGSQRSRNNSDSSQKSPNNRKNLSPNRTIKP